MEGQAYWVMCTNIRTDFLIEALQVPGLQSFVVFPVVFLALILLLPGPLLIFNKHWFNKCIFNLQIRFEYWLLISVFP